jgi:hypothetical protein
MRSLYHDDPATTALRKGFRNPAPRGLGEQHDEVSGLAATHVRCQPIPRPYTFLLFYVHYLS